jgi:Carboxylesterase family
MRCGDARTALHPLPRCSPLFSTLGCFLAAAILALACLLFFYLLYILIGQYGGGSNFLCSSSSSTFAAALSSVRDHFSCVSYFNMLSLLLPWLSLLGTSTSAPTNGVPSGSPPTVTVKNGTYVGTYSPGYKQDFFLGMPYAQPPVDDLRFRIPQSLNTSWSGTHSAEQYSAECVGYGSDQWNYPISEDCLYLNVIRPSGYEGHKLPIAFWIHGTLSVEANSEVVC